MSSMYGSTSPSILNAQPVAPSGALPSNDINGSAESTLARPLSLVSSSDGATTASMDSLSQVVSSPPTPHAQPVAPSGASCLYSFDGDMEYRGPLVDPSVVGSSPPTPNAQPLAPFGVLPLDPPTLICLGDRDLPCSLECGLWFSTSHVHKHIRDHHEPDLVRVDEKTVCPFLFCSKRVTNFPRHFLEHYDIVLYVCSRCGFQSIRRGNVKRHVKSNLKYPTCRVVVRDLDE
ncbi:hypothetical protein EV421DRAFT_1899633 [Armillaria borealis]|uniref:C2H2-type domain-containing protein n=1 Tax=Armillaria borealis TaxID=47425 RepID=A0AA39JWJ0_9AGAR|nr:hypothetical protein EV421DRAFT_1899633 [Armillaria borealis]